MTRAGRLGALFSTVLFLSRAGMAQEVSRADSTVTKDGLAEVAPVLQVLSDAGVPPTREDLAEFLAEVKRAGMDSPPQRRASPLVSGSLLLRMGRYQGEGDDRYGKITLETGWLRGYGRIRESRSGARETTGALEAGRGRFEIRVGDLGLVQGHGLLVGPPGRTVSLGADSGFSPRNGRLVTWLGPPDSRALCGVGGRAVSGPWELRFLHGGSRKDRGRSRAGVSVVQLGARGPDWNISGAAMSGGPACGASLAGRLKKGALSGSLETLLWRSGSGIPWTGAAVMQLGWRPKAGSGLEMMMAYADLAGPPPLASRPAVLTAWDGRGFALRGFVRLEPGTVLRAMLHLGRNPDRYGVRSRQEKSLVDFQAVRRISPLVSLAVRYRASGQRTWAWSERYPWQPAREVSSRRRTILSVQADLARAGTRFRLLVRTYGAERRDGAGRRSLISLGGARSWGRNWRFRGSWVSAWGNPEDLVSAVSPMVGMVLPRHWGKWRSETVAGLEWTVRHSHLQTAVSRRCPAAGQSQGPVWTIWGEAAVRW